MLGIGTGIMNAAGAGAGGGGGGGFNPSQLTLIGAYELFDRSSCFQSYRNLLSNVASYRPVSKSMSDTDPIGTIMDKSQLPGWDGTQTFQEWLDATTPDVDHDFSSDPGYTLGSGWTITGGNLVATASSALATYDFSAENNTFYYYELTFGSYTSGSFGVDFGGNTGTINVAGIGSTTFQGVIWSGASGNGNLEITAATGTFEIASIKVWKAPGNHLFATANDRLSAQTDGNAITFARGSNGDWLISDAADNVVGAQVSMLTMFQANAATMENYGGVIGIGNNGTSLDSILFGNSSGASTFTPNILTDDGTTTTDEYTRGSSTTALHIHEYDWNGATAFTVYEDGTQVATGTPATTVDMSGQTNNRISLFTTPAASDSFNSWGDVYAAYLYEDARSADLFTYVNTATGENF